MSVSLELQRLLILIVLACALGGQERGVKIYRCQWLFDTSSTTVVNNPSSLSRCREQLTSASYQKYCLLQRQTEVSCHGGGLWTCESVRDVCKLQATDNRLSSIVQTDSVTEPNRDALYTRQPHSHNEAACITTGIFAFLLGVASATTGFVVLAWRHMLLSVMSSHIIREEHGIQCLQCPSRIIYGMLPETNTMENCFKKDRSSRPDSVCSSSGVYQDSHRAQEQATSQIRSVIRNPNYCQDDDQIPSSTDHQVSSNSKASSTAYEQLQYGETAGKEVTVPDNEADPSRAPSYKYIDMTRPMGTVPIGQKKSDAYLYVPKPALGDNVEYSVVVKQK